VVLVVVALRVGDRCSGLIQVLNRSGFSSAVYRRMGLCHVSIRNSFGSGLNARVVESLPEQKCEFAAMKKVATKLGISPEAIRRWKRQSEVDSGLRPGLSAQEHDEIRRLRRENAELRRANEILKSASAFFAAELDRPTTK
jgi:transposase